MEKVLPGLQGVKTITVSDAQLATHLGSGQVEVFATPAMIALIESAAVSAIDPLLPEEQASVGIAVDVRHLAATPRDQQVRAQAEVTAIDGRRVTFRVQVWDEQELIGEGTHTRYVIDVARFTERVQSKARTSSSA